MSTAELPPSKLGTKEHWDQVYERELTNFEEIGDEGEIWFGEDSVEKMVDWAVDNIPPTDNPTILEVGSGNGTLLFGLHEAGYGPTLLAGIDYSMGAVKLARGIAVQKTKEGRDEEDEDEAGEEVEKESGKAGADQILFDQCDFLEDTPLALPIHSEGAKRERKTGVWDLLLDKGTYDAIALGEKDEQGRSPAVRYPGRVVRLLKPGGIFLITCGSSPFRWRSLPLYFHCVFSMQLYRRRTKSELLHSGNRTGLSVRFRCWPLESSF
ncbi:chaperone, variant 3 [Coprinopsis cinerea AmutBmut pab1-1]|nr:chaperone, variant 3 [Coprinopsis cinerea AmutBmut pab1-1]